MTTTTKCCVYVENRKSASAGKSLLAVVLARFVDLPYSRGKQPRQSSSRTDTRHSTLAKLDDVGDCQKLA